MLLAVPLLASQAVAAPTTANHLVAKTTRSAPKNNGDLAVQASQPGPFPSGTP
jgi:hypothetical protein